MTAEKSKFLKSLRERLGPHPQEFIKDIIYIFGPDTQSKGGKGKAAKRASEIASRDQKLRAEFEKLMQSSGLKRHEVVGKLAQARGVTSEAINRLLRRTSGAC